MINERKILFETDDRMYVAEPEGKIGVWEMGEVESVHLKTVPVSSIFTLLHELAKASEVDWAWAKNRIHELI